MKTTVQKAYVGGQRVIANSKGEVYSPGEGWSKPVSVQIVKVGQRYERWQDVPQAWVGHSPFWR